MTNREKAMAFLTNPPSGWRKADYKQVARGTGMRPRQALAALQGLHNQGLLRVEETSGGYNGKGLKLYSPTNH